MGNQKRVKMGNGKGGGGTDPHNTLDLCEYFTTSRGVSYMYVHG